MAHDRKQAFNSAFLDSVRDSHDLCWQTIFAMKKDKEQNWTTSIQRAIQSYGCAAEHWANCGVVDEAHCKDGKIMSERDVQETLKWRISCVSVRMGGINCLLDRKITGLRSKIQQAHQCAQMEVLFLVKKKQRKDSKQLLL